MQQLSNLQHYFVSNPDAKHLWNHFFRAAAHLGLFTLNIIMFTPLPAGAIFIKIIHRIPVITSKYLQAEWKTV